MYQVVVATPDGDLINTDLKHESVDYLPMEFHKFTTGNVGEPNELLTLNRFYIMSDDDDEIYGTMIWVEAAGHKTPVLMVYLNHRNNIMVYDLEGNMLRHNSIEEAKP